MRADAHASRHFCGVFPADMLPRQLEKLPALLVANSDCSHLPGQHWVAIHVDAQGRGEYFDSFGRPPVVRAHRQFMDRVCEKWSFNRNQLQDLGGIVCGQYCIMYLLHKAHNRSLEEFVCNMFSKDTTKNDEIVNQLFKNFSKCVKQHDNMSQTKRNKQTCCALKML